MLTFNNKEYRNLQEQVEKNAQDIADFRGGTAVLNQFGIKVVGLVETADEIPSPADYSGDYGDAYLVGTEVPYTLYIFTRPLEGQVITTPSWIEIGQFPMPGPQGEVGPEGPQGPIGENSVWLETVGKPNEAVGNLGDMALDQDSGDVYYKRMARTETGSEWWLLMNIMGPRGRDGVAGAKGEDGAAGPQGPQGPKGDKGDVGGFINIRGELISYELLPDPAELNDPTAAYLVGANRDLYIQIGDSRESRTWNNVGMLNVGTYVTVNGDFQNVWTPDELAADIEDVASQCETNEAMIDLITSEVNAIPYTYETIEAANNTHDAIQAAVNDVEDNLSTTNDLATAAKNKADAAYELADGKVDPSALNNYATTTALNSGLSGKQDTLTPGEGITIENNVISATGGSGGAELVYIAEDDDAGTVYIKPTEDKNLFEVEILAGLAGEDPYNDNYAQVYEYADSEVSNIVLEAKYNNEDIGPTVAQIEVMANEEGTTINLNADSVNINGNPLGGICVHTCNLIAKDSTSTSAKTQCVIRFTIINNDPTPITYNSLRSYLTNYGYTTNTNAYPATGNLPAVISSVKYPIIGIYQQSGKELGYWVSSETGGNITYPSTVVITDQVAQY